MMLGANQKRIVTKSGRTIREASPQTGIRRNEVRARRCIVEWVDLKKEIRKR
jgi:hypothetical protein